MRPCKIVFATFTTCLPTLSRAQQSGIPLSWRTRNATELCAACLGQGQYFLANSNWPRGGVRGRTGRLLRSEIQSPDHLKSQAILRRQLVCSHRRVQRRHDDDRIIKATVALLVRSDISKARKEPLKKLMVFFAAVREIDLHGRLEHALRPQPLYTC